MIKFSIIIPAYEMKSKGVDFLKVNIENIIKQTYSNYEIIISDHSKNFEIQNYIENLCLSANSKIAKKIFYLKCTTGYGYVSANLNNAIKYSTGQVIKPMFQDDYMFDKNTLSILYNHFKKGAKWVACGSNVTNDYEKFYNPFTPFYNNTIITGNNTISSPSCIAYKRDLNIKWDNRLRWLVDCVFYHRLNKISGLPVIEKKILITNFSHKDQVSNWLSEKEKEYEYNLIKKEWKIK